MRFSLNVDSSCGVRGRYNTDQYRLLLARGHTVEGRRDMGILGLGVGQRAAGVVERIHSRYLHVLT